MNSLKLFLNFKGKDYYIGDIYYTSGIFSFECSSEYIENPNLPIIDPLIKKYFGRQYPDELSFGFIEDMIPDRFGKRLIDIEEKSNRKLNSFDYLVRVNDLSRMGALRIKETIDGPFINEKKDVIPPYNYLRDIEQASYELEKEGTLKDDLFRRLLLPGSSLGGARPKSNIYFNDEVYIAKFPSKGDDYDVELLEYITLRIAKLCGINVPDCNAQMLSKNGYTLLVKRFDRDGNNRIHYLSGVTALATNDGRSDLYSYLDLVNFIRSNGVNVKEDLKELYRRIIFTYLINNTDNHLRNHAFIMEEKGYKLSPMFDVNPSLFEGDFALSFGLKDNKEGIIEIAEYFSYTKIEANDLFKKEVDIILKELDNYKSQYSEISKQIETIQNIIKTRL